MQPNPHLPTLRQLQYLIAVVELAHFGKAAERCCVTQSTLSAGIQELEGILGTTLLERNKRRVIVTPTGEQVAAKARQILTLAADLTATARPTATPLSGHLSLGVIPTIGPFLLPKVLPAIRARYPALELTLVEERSAQLVEQVESGKLDTAVLAFPYPLRTLERLLFWHENFVVALPTGHPLTNQPVIATESLPADQLLLLQEGHCLTDHALAACRLEGLKAHAAFQGTSLYTLMQMVAGGQGITFLPEMAIGEELLRNREIHLIRLQEPGPHREIGLIWRSSYGHQADLRTLADEMRQRL